MASALESATTEPIPVPHDEIPVAHEDSERGVPWSYAVGYSLDELSFAFFSCCFGASMEVAYIQV